MLELLFRGFFEWIYGLILECWEYFSSVLFDLMSLDFAYDPISGLQAQRLPTAAVPRRDICRCDPDG